MMKQQPTLKNHFSRPPVRRGEVYCSPWCGGGCTWTAYQKAKRESSALQKSLGEGWEARVWENLGWHWEVKSPCRRMRVHPIRGGYFSAGFGNAGDNCGAFYVASSKSPRAAIRKAFQEAKEDIAKMNAVFAKPVTFKP